MKKRVLCVMMMIILLSACDINKPSDLESSEQSQDNTTQEPAELNEVTQKDIESAWEARLTVDRDYYQELPQIKITDAGADVNAPYSNLITYTWYGNIEVSGDNYELLSSSVLEIMEKLKSKYSNEINSIINQNISEHCRLILGANIERIDNRVLSFYAYNQTNYDNGECISRSEGYTLDVLTGKILDLTDVIEDEDRFWIYTKEKIIDNISENDNLILKDDYEEVISKMDEAVDGWSWTLNASGMLISINAGVICDNGYSFVIPYRECANLFNPEYLPGNSAFYGEVSINVDTEAFNDNCFRINCESIQGMPYSNPEMVIGDHSELIIPTSEYQEAFGDNYFMRWSGIIRRNDGKEYLFINLGSINSMGQLFRIYDITNGEADIISDAYFWQYNNIIIYDSENGFNVGGLEFRWDSIDDWSSL